MRCFVLLQLAATATTYHLSPPHGHGRVSRAVGGQLVLLSPEDPEAVSGDERNPLDDISGAFKGGIEDAVKKVTGNDEYQFGDFTKSTVKGLTGKEAGDYQCKDARARTSNWQHTAARARARVSVPERASLRPRAVGDVTKKAISEITGKDASEYKFGDVTSSLLAAADQSVNDYANDIQKRLLGDLSQTQRAALVGVGLKTGAMVVLTYGFLDKILRAVSFILAWAVSISSTRLSPLAAGQWGAFVTTHATIRMVYVPVLFPLHVLATVALALPYRSLILSLQRRLPLQKRPWLNVGLALAITFAGGTGLATSAAGAGVWLASFVVGVPVFPVGR